MPEVHSNVSLRYVGTRHYRDAAVHDHWEDFEASIPVVSYVDVSAPYPLGWANVICYINYGSITFKSVPEVVLGDRKIFKAEAKGGFEIDPLWDLIVWLFSN